mmetsp:Transcript_82904/g.222377  ORF Transcript_82904/g.222377 Transcript_82904/m.222377 type:complete len:308 (-) Transcript_82904:1187-2110(-)
MALGKFLRVQMGMAFSGGSLDELYDTDWCGITTWTLPLVPRVPESRSGLRKKTHRWSMYMRAGTLSSALKTPSSPSKKPSSNSPSVSGPTLDEWATTRSSGFISLALRAAATDLSCCTSDSRNRNCRLRLERSMLSMSVTCTWPLGPQPTPMRAKFLSASQPMAPAPTSMYLRFMRRSCTVLPSTTTCGSYRVPSGQNSSVPIFSMSSGYASSASNINHWRMGMNLPVHALTASCAAMLPMTLHMGARVPAAPWARRRTSASSTSSTSLRLTSLPSTDRSWLNWRASSTTASASSFLPGRGSRSTWA